MAKPAPQGQPGGHRLIRQGFRYVNVIFRHRPLVYRGFRANPGPHTSEKTTGGNGSWETRDPTKSVPSATAGRVAPFSFGISGAGAEGWEEAWAERISGAERIPTSLAYGWHGWWLEG